MFDVRFSVPRGGRLVACPRLQSKDTEWPFSCKRGKETSEIGPKHCRVYTSTAIQGRFCVNAEKQGRGACRSLCHSEEGEARRENLRDYEKRARTDVALGA